MKPRLETLPLTQEDGIALRHMLERWYRRYPRTVNIAPMAMRVWQADRRDADVMLHIEQSKIGTEGHWHKGAHSILRGTIFIGGDPGVAFTVRPW